MAKYIDQALELCDQFIAVAAENRQLSGSDFAPLSPNDIRASIGQWVKESLAGKSADDLRAEKTKIQEQFDASISSDPLQARLKAAYDAAEAVSQIHYNDETAGNYEDAKKMFEASLTPQQHQWENEIEMVELKIRLASMPDFVDSALKNILKGFKDNNVLTIDLPSSTRDYVHLAALIDLALDKVARNQNLPGGHTMYNVKPDLVRHALHITVPEELTELDLSAVRKELDTTVREELANSKWKKVPSSKGVTYEYAYKKADENSIDSVAHLLEKLKSQAAHKGHIAVGHRIEGKFVKPGERFEIDHERAADPDFLSQFPSVIRVTGAEEIKDTLIDGMGVKGIQLPPQERAR